MVWRVGDTPQCKLFTGAHTHSGAKVCTLIDQGKWDPLESISQIVDSNAISSNSILLIYIPVYSQASDHPTCVGSTNGNFTVSAAYDLINKRDTDSKG